MRIDAAAGAAGWLIHSIPIFKSNPTEVFRYNILLHDEDFARALLHFVINCLLVTGL
jgi:hypothetical protein